MEKQYYVVSLIPKQEAISISQVPGTRACNKQVLEGPTYDTSTTHILLWKSSQQKVHHCDYLAKSFGNGKATGWAKYILTLAEYSN